MHLRSWRKKGIDDKACWTVDPKRQNQKGCDRPEQREQGQSVAACCIVDHGVAAVFVCNS